MAQIDPTTVNVEDVIQRIQAVRRGELPADAVSVEELRAAIEQQRKRFAAGAMTPAGEGNVSSSPKKRLSSKSKLIVPDDDGDDEGAML